MSQTKAQLISDLVQALAFTATASAPTNGMFLSASNTLAISTNSTQRLTVDSSGNVGIGTSSVDEHLHIEGSGSNERIKIENTTSNVAGLVLLNTNRRYDVQVNGSALQVFDNTGSTERLRIDSSGRLLIGTSTGDGQLEVRNSNGIISRAPSTQATDTNKAYRARNNSDTDTFSLSYKGQAYFAGNVGIGTTSPGNTLHLKGAQGVGIRFENSTSTNSSYLTIESGDKYQFNVGGSGFYAWVTGGSEKVRIDGSGRLLVGTSTALTSPTGSRIQVSGNDFATSSIRQTRYQTAEPGASLILSHARGTEASPTILADGDEVGKIRWHAYDGTDFECISAEIKAQIDGTIQENQSPSRLLFSTTASGASSPTERLRIDSSGRLLIGSSVAGNADADNINVAGSGNVGITFRGSSSGTGNIFFADSTSGDDLKRGQIVYNHADNSMSLVTNAVERLRIDSSGRLLIGATSATNLIRLGQAFAVSTTSDFGGGSFTGFNGTTAAEGPILDLQRSRGTSTVGTVVASGDRLGSLVFRGDDGTDFADAAYMLGEVDGTPSGGFVPGRFAFYTGTTSAIPVERMRIKSDGTLHVIKTGTQITNAEQTVAVFQRSSASGTTSKISIVSGNAASSHINFGDTDDEDVGQLVYNHSNNSMQFLTNTSEAMRIDSSGKVGIGTSSIDEHLHIEGSGSNERIKIENTTSNVAGLVMLNTSRRYDVQVNGSDLQIFDNTGSADRLRIDSSGNLLVGTTASLGAGGLTIRPNVTEGSPQIVFNRSTTTNTSFCQLFKNAGTDVGSISYTNTTTAFNTSSDYRLKENVVAIADGITRVKQLQPRRFNFIADASKTVDGFLAHEAQAVIPEAVTGTHNEVDDDGNPVYQGIDQSKLVPLLTAALQEAIAKIETLETKVAALEAE